MGALTPCSRGEAAQMVWNALLLVDQEGRACLPTGSSVPLARVRGTARPSGRTRPGIPGTQCPEGLVVTNRTRCGSAGGKTVFKDNAIPGDVVNEKAAVDRLEEDKAVLLVGEAEERLIVDRAKLPPGTREGHC